MRDALIVSVLSVLPRNLFARWMGAFARQRLSRAITRLFVSAYGVDLSEATGSLADYGTLEQLFTRRLVPGARPIDQDARWVSPVDGSAAFLGTTTHGCFEVAPGRQISLSELLGEPVEGERDVAVLYLSPKDYHRVHAPADGRVTRWRYLPGTLWPVFPAAVRRVPGLFMRNERVAVHLDTTEGPVVAVLVGAFGVGRMTLAFADLITNTSGEPRQATVDVPLARGADLGVFHLGSTVILIGKAGALSWVEPAGGPVRMGRALAR